MDSHPPNGDPSVYTFDPKTLTPITPTTADQADTQIGMIPPVPDDADTPPSSRSEPHPARPDRTPNPAPGYPSARAHAVPPRHSAELGPPIRRAPEPRHTRPYPRSTPTPRPDTPAHHAPSPRPAPEPPPHEPFQGAPSPVWPEDPANPLETAASPAMIAACALRVAEELDKIYDGHRTFGEIKERADAYRTSAANLAAMPHTETATPRAS